MATPGTAFHGFDHPTRDDFGELTTQDAEVGPIKCEGELDVNGESFQIGLTELIVERGIEHGKEP